MKNMKKISLTMINGQLYMRENMNGTFLESSDFSYIAKVLKDLNSKNVSSINEYKDVTIISGNNYRIKFPTKYSHDILDILSPVLGKSRNRITINKKVIALVTAGIITLSMGEKLQDESKAASDDEIVTEILEVIDVPAYNDNIEEPIVIIDNPLLVDNTFETRCSQAEQFYNGELDNPAVEVGVKLDDYTKNVITDFVNSEGGEILFNYSAEFNVDPYLMIALFLQESSLNHEATLKDGSNYNGYAVGISQIELPHIKNNDGSDRSIVAFNYMTNKEEVVYINDETTHDLETNIKLGVMNIQNYLKRYNGNPFMASYAHNVGNGVIDVALYTYSLETGYDIKSIKENYSDFGWLKYVEEMCLEPHKFAAHVDPVLYSEYNATISYLKDWPEEKYGDSNYLGNVFGQYMGRITSNFGVNIDLTTNNLIDSQIVIKEETYDKGNSR